MRLQMAPVRVDVAHKYYIYKKESHDDRNVGY